MVFRVVNLSLLAERSNYTNSHQICFNLYYIHPYPTVSPDSLKSVLSRLSFRFRHANPTPTQWWRHWRFQGCVLSRYFERFFDITNKALIFIQLQIPNKFGTKYCLCIVGPILVFEQKATKFGPNRPLYNPKNREHFGNRSTPRLKIPALFHWIGMAKLAQMEYCQYHHSAGARHGTFFTALPH